MRNRPPPFQVFLEDNRGAVMAFLRASVGPNDADDCFQETFIAALRAYPRLTDGSNLRSWALKIAQRKAVDLHRARRRTTPMPPDQLPDPAIRDGTPEPELWRAVGALPTKQRLAIAHRYVLDLPYREIGSLIGSSEEAARQSVREGLKRMRKEMESDD